MIDESVPYDLRHIIEYVNDSTGLIISERTRKHNYTFARACAANLCERWTGRSLSEIGRALGVGHDTIIHYRKVYPQAIANPFYEDIMDGFDPVLMRSVLSGEHYANRCYREAYLSVKEELVKLQNAISVELEPHELEYRKLSDEHKKAFAVMAEAKLRMLKVKHEVK